MDAASTTARAHVNVTKRNWETQHQSARSGVELMNLDRIHDAVALTKIVQNQGHVYLPPWQLTGCCSCITSFDDI